MRQARSKQWTQDRNKRRQGSTQAVEAERPRGERDPPNPEREGRRNRKQTEKGDLEGTKVGRDRQVTGERTSTQTIRDEDNSNEPIMNSRLTSDGVDDPYKKGKSTQRTKIDRIMENRN